MGYEVGRIGIEAQIENARGLIEVDAIAKASARVETIIFGPADFMAQHQHEVARRGRAAAGYDVGDAYHYILMQILMAARANEKLAIDGPYLQIRDVEGFARWPAARPPWVRRQVVPAPRPDRGGQRDVLPAPGGLRPRRADPRRLRLVHVLGRGARGAAMLGDEMIDEASRKMALVIAAKGRAAALSRTESFTPPE